MFLLAAKRKGRQMADDGQLISTGGVAAELGVGISTVRFWAANGVLPPPQRLIGSGRRAWRVGDLPEMRQRVASRPDRRKRRRATDAPAT